MGIFPGTRIELFIATPDELAALNFELSPAEQLPTPGLEGLDPAKVAHLESVMRNVGVCGGIARIELVEEVSHRGPWITAVSRELPEVIAALSESAFRTTVRRWASLEKLEADGWTESAAREALCSLQRVCRAALDSDRRMYFWMCAP